MLFLNKQEIFPLVYAQNKTNLCSQNLPILSYIPYSVRDLVLFLVQEICPYLHIDFSPLDLETVALLTTLQVATMHSTPYIYRNL